MLSRQGSCIEVASRVADVVVWGGGTHNACFGEGMDRASVARLAGMDRQTLRDWVHRYNAEGIAGLCNRPAPGRRPKLSEGQMAALKAVVLAGPDPAGGQNRAVAHR